MNLSIDDVIECFRWVYRNKPNSIFDEPMLGQIREWHLQYGLTCNLYVFEECVDFSLEQLQKQKLFSQDVCVIHMLKSFFMSGHLKK